MIRRILGLVCCMVVVSAGTLHAKLVRMNEAELRSVRGQGMITEELTDLDNRNVRRQLNRYVNRQENENRKQYVEVRPARKPDAVRDPIDYTKNRIAARAVEATINRGIQKIDGVSLNFNDILNFTQTAIQNMDTLQKSLEMLQKLDQNRGGGI